MSQSDLSSSGVAPHPNGQGYDPCQNGNKLFTIRRSKYAPTIALAMILLCAAALRLHGLRWDGGMGAFPHPDERHLANTIAHVSLPWPPDWENLLDPAVSALNPRRVNPDDPSGARYDLAYGTLPIYLYRAMAALLTKMTKVRWDSYDRFFLVGRGITLAFSLVTILLVYLIGQEIYGRRTALLAATLLSLSVTHIQLSHFMTVDIILTTFIVACLYMGLCFVRRGRWANALGMGVAMGGAMATKVTGTTLGAALVAACLLWSFHPTKSKNLPAEGSACGHAGPSIAKPRFFFYPLLIILGAFLIFAIFEFYAVLDRATYLQAVSRQGEMVSGKVDWPFTRQYVNTTPYLYHLDNLVRWGLGPPLGIAALGGLLFVAWQAFIRPLLVRQELSSSRSGGQGLWLRWLGSALYAEPTRWGSLFLLSWALPYFLLIGRLEVKFMRYMLPLTPLLCLFGAEMILRLADWVSHTAVRRKGKWGDTPQAPGEGDASPAPLLFAGWIQAAIIGLVLIPTALWALAFSHIYDRPHTWLEASRWIYANAPPGSVLTQEAWDDSLPVDLPAEGKLRDRYPPPIKIDIYQDMVPEEKFHHLIDAIHRADYIILATPRLYEAVRRLPWRYPVEIRYYELLFSGRLGFELAHASTSYPSLWGLTFVDDEADESFSVYDHPKVLIYHKVRDLSDGELRGLFGEALLARPLVIRRGGKWLATLPVPRYRKTLMLEGPVDALPTTEEYGWNRLANAYPFLAVLIWLAVLEITALLALPLAAALFPSFADRGYLLAKALGLLLLAYFTWLPVQLGLWPYCRAALGVALLLLPMASLLILRQEGKGLAAALRRRWRDVLFSEGVFLAAFLFFLFLRLGNPDLWHPARGGEKPMEFGFLNAILCSPTMPPYDPFFSGGYINYYYYGLFLVSTLVKATGIAPSVAFNLIIPTLFALTVGGAFSVVHNLTGGRRYGLVGGLFVAVVGNLAAVSPIRGQGGLPAIIVALRQLASPQTQGNLSQILEGLGRWLAGTTLPLPTDWFWQASRVHGSYEVSITEFPFFSFLFADLHPHTIGIPFAILVIALALSLTLRGKRVPSPISKPALRLRTLKFGLICLCLGALAVINSWDFPVYVLVIGGALLLRCLPPEQSPSISLKLLSPTTNYMRKRAISTLLGLAAVATGTALLAGGGLILYVPFFTYYKAFVKGFGRVTHPTEVRYYIGMFGFFLFVLASYLTLRAFTWPSGEASRDMSPDSSTQGDEDEKEGNGRPQRAISTEDNAQHRGEALHAPALLLGEGRWLFLTVILFPLLALLILPRFYGQLNLQQLATFIFIGELGIITVSLLKKRISIEERFTLLLGLIGLAISLGVEVIYVRDHLSGGPAYRMNTVFKFYIQVWVLLAIAAAASLGFITRGPLGWEACQRVSSRSESLPGEGNRRHLRRFKGWRNPLVALWWGCFLALFLCISIYPVFGIQTRLRDRFPVFPPWGTLDGLAYMPLASYDWEGHTIPLEPDYQAIRWLLRNMEGTPIILQADHEFYRANGVRIAYNTGFPTVLNQLHENEQRYPEQVSQRHRDVETIYNHTDPEVVLPLLAGYGVSYIYVGPFERIAYRSEGLAKFDRWLGSYLDLVYDEQGVRIYRLPEETKSAYRGKAPGVQSLPLTIPTLAPAPSSRPEEDELKRLERAARAQPNDLGLQFQLGDRYRQLGRYEDAVRVFREFLRRHPQDVAMYHTLGDTYEEMGQAERAMEQYRAAVQVALDNPAAHNKLGMVYLKRNRLEEAVAAFRAAIEADPSFIEAYYHLGEAHERRGEIKEAKAAYREGVAKGGDSIWAEGSLGRLKALEE